jgi:hypothetical protein
MTRKTTKAPTVTKAKHVESKTAKGSGKWAKAVGVRREAQQRASAKRTGMRG